MVGTGAADRGTPATPVPPARPRIVIVTPAFPPSVGGSERYHVLMAHGLAPRAEVTVLTSDLLLAGGAAPFRSPDMTVEYLPSRYLGGERWIRPAALRRRLGEIGPDLIWTNEPSATGLIAGRFARKHGVPWVATYHADLDPSSWVRRLFTRIEHRTLRGASLIFVSSETYRAREVARGIRPENLLAAPLGPYLGPTVRAQGPPAALDRPGPDHPYLFIGGLDRGHAYKRLDLLLEAFARTPGLRDARLWVAGDGDERPSWERWIHEHGLADRVVMLGRLSDEALVDRLRAAWALAVPSISASEGFSVVTVEAACAGCPIVASDTVPAARLVAKSGGALLYDARDPAALGTTLAGLWGASERRAQLAAGAWAAGASLGWDALLPGLIDPVLERATRSPRSRAGA